MQRDHAPGLRHYSAKLALNAERLSEQTYIRGEHRQNCCPISDQRIHQPAVRNPDKNHDVGNAIGQIVQDFTGSARLPRRERYLTVEHVDPEPQITKERRNNEQPTSRARFPKTNCSDQRRYDRQIRNRIGMNSVTHTEPRSSISSSPKDCRNWPPRRMLVIRHCCHFVKQRIRLATQTTIELVQIKKTRECRVAPKPVSLL